MNNKTMMSLAFEVAFGSYLGIRVAKLVDGLSSELLLKGLDRLSDKLSAKIEELNSEETEEADEDIEELHIVEDN